MPEKNILVSGPAGGGKSPRVQELLNDSEGPAIQVEFQALYVALTGDVRDPVTGRYPLRNEDLLPTVEYLKRAAASTATARGIRVVMSNSDGDPDRRGDLLDLLGPSSTELIVDPGEAVAAARLAEADGVPSAECKQALNRWYTRKYRDNPRRPRR